VADNLVQNLLICATSAATGAYGTRRTAALRSWWPPFFGLGVKSRVPGMPMPVCPARLAGLLISGRVPVVARDAS